MSNLCMGPFVRAVTPNGVAIWTEWSHPCDITLTATPADHASSQPLVTRSHTVTVGGRYYALSRLRELQAATWYNYHVSASNQEPEMSAASEIVQCFRTFDVPAPNNSLRLAYGSCRRLATTEPDALSALGPWLTNSLDQRESLWPHLLLLIGDQIYADDYVKNTNPCSSQARPMTTQSFEDFARLYAEAWTTDIGIRQAFAVLPTYMIFDDHEITNAWNIMPNWRASALQQGFEQTLVDGLLAYWIYQGWGNIGLQEPCNHVLLTIMQEAEQSGHDILEDLRACILPTIHQETAIPWHYTIDTQPPLFVADMRADRPSILDGTNPADVAHRIMSQEQMTTLQTWMQAHANSTTLLVSSMPAILPPLIGFAEYTMGMQPFLKSSTSPLKQLRRVLGAIQQKLALGMSFDHWPVLGDTWHELVSLLASRTHDIVILSGDVHFSYAMAARTTLFPTQKHATLYQLVASPFRNVLEPHNKRLVLMQAWLKHALYGGLHSYMLPLLQPQKTQHVPHDILFQNVVALVTCSPHEQHEGAYSIQQVYLGIKNTELEEIASSTINIT